MSLCAYICARLNVCCVSIPSAMACRLQIFSALQSASCLWVSGHLVECFQSLSVGRSLCLVIPRARPLSLTLKSDVGQRFRRSFVGWDHVTPMAEINTVYSSKKLKLPFSNSMKNPKFARHLASKSSLNLHSGSLRSRQG